MSETSKKLRSGRVLASTSLTPTPTPPSGQTTEATTNTWDRGSGSHHEETNSNASRQSRSRDRLERTLVKSTAGTVVDAPAQGNKTASATNDRRDRDIEMLMTELRVCKANLTKAQEQAEAARLSLETARIEVQSSRGGDRAEDRNSERRVDSWVESQSRLVSQNIQKTQANNAAPRKPTTREYSPRDRSAPRAPPALPANHAPISSRPHYNFNPSVPPFEMPAHYAPIVHRPAPELPPFDGNISEWVSFKAEYMDSAPLFSSVQNVSRIRRALKGEARIAVKSIMYTVRDPREIMESLERQFGDPDEIILTELHGIKKMPRLAEDSSNIGTFAAHIANAVATIRSLGHERYLYAPELVNKIVDKLNLIIRYEWAKYRQSNYDTPDLLAMSNFLSEISAAAKRTNRPRAPLKSRAGVHNVCVDRDRYNTNDRSRAYRGYCSSDSECDDYEPPRPRHSDKQRRPPVVAQLKQNEPKKKPAPPVARQRERDVHPRNSASSRADAPSPSRCPTCNEVAEHKPSQCKKLISASVSDRWELVKKAKLCFRCLGRLHRKPEKCSFVPCGINQCEAGHHKLLHGLHSSASVENSKAPPKVNTIRLAPTYLKMVQVEVTGPLGATEALALLDEGAGLSMITHEVADRVIPHERGEPFDIQGIGGVLTNNDSRTVRVALRGFYNRNLESLDLVTVEHTNVGSQGVPRELIDQCDHLKNIADELCYPFQMPSIVIGQDNWHLIISREIMSGRPHLPVASLTRLGWALHGPHSNPRAMVPFINHMRPKTPEDEILELMKSHFDIESLGVVKKLPRDDPDRRALELLESTCTEVAGESRFRAGLLWRSDDVRLPDNRPQALKRLFSLEKKLDRDESLKVEYSRHMNNLFEKGYAEKVDMSAPPSDKLWYLPHFPTFHPQKGKMRLVWDAAAVTKGTSLNSALLAGPDLLESLFGVLVRFREGKTAVIADIKEMFLQIEIVEQDRDALRFVWRGEDRANPPQEYRMRRLIFGSAASPTTALFVKNKNALLHAAEFPIAAEKTVKNTYMDDVLMAFDEDEATVRRVVNEIYELNKRASFELRGFASNRPAVISDVSNSNLDTALIARNDMERTLGLKWNHASDTLGFNVNMRNTPVEVLNGSRLPTKREVTSAAMSIFDPIGYVSPISVLGKALIQEIWRTGISWDDPISDALAPAWRSFIDNVQQLRNLEIPRHVIAYNREVDLHTFCDASEKIYAAAVYVVSRGPDGLVRSALVAAKARVSPLKVISIPRLELQSCVLATRLADTIVKESDYTINKRYFWSDAKTALSWIRSDPRRYKSFVAHRVAEIEGSTTPADWHWVPSALNVADDATKGVPAEFDAKHRWFNGPEFIRQDSKHWPVEKLPAQPTDTGEERVPKTVCSATAAQNKFAYLPEVSRYSKFTRLVRAVGRTLVAAENFKAVLYKKKPVLELSNDHISLAEILLIRRSQHASFDEEIKLMETGRTLPKKSPLYKIAMKLDKNGVIVLDSRIDRGGAHIPVLHAKEDFTKLLINHFHALFNHGNHATVINEMKQRYYIIGLRGSIRYIANKCQWCRTYKGPTLTVPVGDLPPERLKANQPAFTAAAVDLFGPMHITIGRRREKRWGVLFTCLTTRAVHLELAASLSASSMILSLRRMIARRGAPTVIYSDNATNFYGAERELSEALHSLPDTLKTILTERRIVWKKIPPGNPSAGGAWERLVGSVKTALKVTLKDRAPHEEVLHTLLLEAEHLVNSRPLTPVNPDLEKECLTPNHFLIGRSCAMSPLGAFNDEILSLTSWKTAQHLADHFWRRWVKEYRPSLAPRPSTHQQVVKLHTGDVVLIADSSMPRGTWPRGVITSLFPGPDGHVRAAIVRTKAGELRRPVSRLILLCSTINDATARGGECRI